MVKDPYSVLGVSSSATQDEIKSAYRKKAKQYHPDLHPNDPNATAKMNEVNEAYEILSNPDKKAAYEASKSQGSGYSAYGHSYQSYGSSQQQSQQSQQSSYGYEGQGGWSSMGFDDFFNMFGFGGFTQSANTTPQREAGDSAAMAYAISYINSGMYASALKELMYIPSYERGARWFYVSAVANYGAGNRSRAFEHIQKAVQLDPNNQIYKTLLMQYRNASGGSGSYYNSYGGNNYNSYGGNNYSSQSGQQNTNKTYYRKSSSPFGGIIRFVLWLLFIQFIFRVFFGFMNMGIYMLH